MKIKFTAVILYAVLTVLCACGCSSCHDYKVTYSYRSQSLTTNSEISPNNAEVVLFTDTQKAGKNVTLAIKAKPQTEYKIEVEYSGGVSNSKDLSPKITDANGYAAWIWKISYRTKHGRYPVRIYYKNRLITTLQLKVEAK